MIFYSGLSLHDTICPTSHAHMALLVEVGGYQVHFIQKIARSNLICSQKRASIIMVKGACSV